MFSHLDKHNQPAMVDIGGKPVSHREALAQAVVRLPPEITALFRDGDLHGKKGPVFQTAILAGIMAAKKTSDLIPLCHPLPLTDCKITIELNPEREAVIRCRVATDHKTGVEMEALTGVSVAALTLYDMCKAVSQNMVIGEIRLLEKTGGKSDLRHGSHVISDRRLENPKPPLYGLVLGGGRSTRMRQDKASLTYHGKPQTEHCLELLAPLCERAFLSCRTDQAQQPGFLGLPQIHDAFLDIGPMGGILSALKAYPEAAFLVIACDLPLLDAPTLTALVNARDPARMATTFKGAQKDLPEPLCAIYEPSAYPRLLQFLGEGVECPRKVLLNSNAAIFPAPNPGSLVNANDPEAYQEALRALGTP